LSYALLRKFPFEFLKLTNNIPLPNLSYLSLNIKLLNCYKLMLWNYASHLKSFSRFLKLFNYFLKPFNNCIVPDIFIQCYYIKLQFFNYSHLNLLFLSPVLWWSNLRLVDDFLERGRSSKGYCINLRYSYGYLDKFLIRSQGLFTSTLRLYLNFPYPYKSMPYYYNRLQHFNDSHQLIFFEFPKTFQYIQELYRITQARYKPILSENIYNRF
jgi:hypothetical protein